MAKFVATVACIGTLADFARRHSLADATVRLWVTRDHDRAAAYQRAREARADLKAGEVIALADAQAASRGEPFRDVAVKICEPLT